MKCFLLLLLSWSQIGLAASKGCRDSLTPQPLNLLVSSVFARRLDTSSTYRLQFQVPTYQNSDLDDLQRPFRGRRVFFNVTRTSGAAGDTVTIDAEIMGLGRDIVAALMDLRGKRGKGIPVMWMAEQTRDEPSPAGSSPSTAELESRLRMSIMDLNLPKRVVAALRGENTVFVGDLVQRTKRDLAMFRNVSTKSLEVVETALAAKGLRLGMETPGWPYEDIDDIAVRFAGQAMIPEFTAAEWLCRTERQASVIFAGNRSGLALTRPVALVRVDQPKELAMIEGEYFEKTKAKDIAAFISTYTYGHLLAGASGERALVQSLSQWKDQPLPSVDLDLILGEAGQSTFQRILSTQIPVAVTWDGAPDKKIILVPVAGLPPRRGMSF